MLAIESNKENFTLINTVQMKDLLLCLLPQTDTYTHIHSQTDKHKQKQTH